MRMRPLTAGAVTGTGTVKLESQAPNPGGILGSVLITTDGTTLGTVVVRRNNATGAILFDLDTTSAQQCYPMVDASGTNVLYYSVTGAGCEAMLYEWVP